ncbi:MAG: prepilin-type N-terminal cleavage/methylation domain-containing protein [Actinomycetota bacterium]|nr:prepilin-type N-terminal cleavage/methylation domain-containing protein [Actinomycetota bacterium]
MIRHARRQDGFTMVELLVVCVISLVVFGATMTAWVSVVHSNTAATNQRDNVETAREAMDRATRQLRNLANPTVNAVTTIDRAADYDLIFQTSDPAKTWVRYCLQTSGGSATPAKAILWEGESPGATLSSAMRGSCPGVGWATSRKVVTGVSNQAGGLDRNIFAYRCAPGAPATCPASTSEYTKITSIGISLWVDAIPTDRVHEMQVSSGVFLRNQNEAPSASASASPNGSRRILFNGSGSTDPEGRTLEYFWFATDPSALPEMTTTACTAPFPSAVWQGVTFNKLFAASEGATGAAKTFYLVVRDPGCLISTTSITAGIPS